MKNSLKILVISMTLLVSCGPSQYSEEMKGQYKFKYPSGQIEIIDIKNERAYTQTIFAQENDFINKNKPLFENSGIWYPKDDQFVFDHWLAYCYIRDPDSILPEPHLTTMLNVYYHGPTNDHNGRIDIYLENGYVFNKVGQ